MQCVINLVTRYAVCGSFSLNLWCCQQTLCCVTRFEQFINICSLQCTVGRTFEQFILTSIANHCKHYVVRFLGWFVVQLRALSRFANCDCRMRWVGIKRRPPALATPLSSSALPVLSSSSLSNVIGNKVLY